MCRREPQREDLVKGDRIVDFPTFMLWKTLCFWDHLALKRHADVNKVTDRQIRTFNLNCAGLGRHIFSTLGDNLELLNNWPAEARSGFIDELLSRASGLLPGDLPDKADFALRTLRCWLRYYRIRWRGDDEKDEQRIHARALEVLTPILRSSATSHAKRMWALNRSGFAHKNFEEWFIVGRASESRELVHIARFYEQNAPNLNQIARRVIALA